MAYTLTSIANEALLKIGEARILDITSTTDINAVRANLLMEGCIREIATEAEWRCLTKRAELTADEDETPAFGWAYAYPLPSDFLRITAFNENDDVIVPEEFVIEGAYILSNEEAVQISYVAYSADPTVFDILFIQCLVLLLASKLAVSCRQEENMSNNLLIVYRQKLSRARQINGMIGSRIKRSPLENTILRRSRFTSTPIY